MEVWCPTTGTRALEARSIYAVWWRGRWFGELGHWGARISRLSVGDCYVKEGRLWRTARGSGKMQRYRDSGTGSRDVGTCPALLLAVSGMVSSSVQEWSRNASIKGTRPKVFLYWVWAVCDTGSTVATHRLTASTCHTHLCRYQAPWPFRRQPPVWGRIFFINYTLNSQYHFPPNTKVSNLSSFDNTTTHDLLRRFQDRQRNEQNETPSHNFPERSLLPNFLHPPMMLLQTFVALAPVCWCWQDTKWFIQPCHGFSADKGTANGHFTVGPGDPL